jgi:putative peptidoglycan lipid II flippase
MLVSFCSIVINFGVAMFAVSVLNLGHAGLALSTSSVAIFSSIALFVIMRNRIGGIYGRNLWRTFSRVTVASVIMAAAVWAASYAVHAQLGRSAWAQLGVLAVALPLGIAILYFACRALGVQELDAAIGALAGPLRRRIPFLRRGGA